MSKVPKQAVIDEITSDDFWEMDLEEEIIAGMDYELREEINRTWHWYMLVETYKPQGWAHVIISTDHKNQTVANWLTDNNVEFKYEAQEFLINDSEIATMVALRWA